MIAEQLNIFNMDIEQDRPKLRRIFTIKKKSTRFNFDDSSKKLSDILNSNNIFNINVIHEVGNILSDMRYYRKNMELKEPDGRTSLLNFWDYVERLFKLDHLYCFECIRTYEIRTLLSENNFKTIPNCISHIKELWDYTDNQIIQIWLRIKNDKKLTTKGIQQAKKETKLENRFLETLEKVNTCFSYEKYLRLFYFRKSLRSETSNNLSDKSEYNKNNPDTDKSINPDYENLKEKYNSIVRDHKNLKKILSDTKHDLLMLEIENRGLKLNIHLSLLNSTGKQSRKSDCLELLQIKKINPTNQEIKKAFKEQASLLHPDKNMNLNDYQRKIFEREFNKIKQAYEFLIKSNSVR
jgi:hypothetical protein